MKALGLIPARGGSKRVPRKNMRLLGDVPLITWTICCAHDSELLDDIVVSSEDPEILKTAREWDAKDLERPEELATDSASPYDVMLHALDALGTYEWLVLLQPTSPFRVPGDIDFPLAMAMKFDMPAVVSIKEGREVPNGAVYIARTDWLRESLSKGEKAPFDGPVPKYYAMPPWRSIDIDTEEDWKAAENMVERFAA